MKAENVKQFLILIRVLGLLLMIEAGFMFLCLIPAAYYGQGDFLPLLFSGLITFSVGAIGRFSCRNVKTDIDKRLGMLIVASIWIVMTIFGTLPYLLSGSVRDLTTAVFETISGFTTTGASNLSDVESLPKGVLFWRSLTHWIGGVGIVVIVISFIPFVGGGAMALFSAETTGPNKTRISPHIGETGKIICSIYFALTAICCLVYWLCGMDFYDAVNHAFSTLASGGFSTKNASAAAFSPLLQYMMILFMIPAGINFILIYYCIKGQFSHLRKSEEFRVYMFGILIATALIFVFILPQSQDVEHALRSALFQTVSIFTSTGFVSEDYTLWHSSAVLVLMLLMFSGAMSGSTTGGLKLVRVILLSKNAVRIIKQGVHSNAYIPIKLDGKVTKEGVMDNVMVIFLLCIIMLLLCIAGLLLTGLELEEALGAAVSCTFNMGPGLGRNGGFGSYAYMPDTAKWILSVVMYLGRLEIATVVALFMPSFWRK